MSNADTVTSLGSFKGPETVKSLLEPILYRNQITPDKLFYPLQCFDEQFPFKEAFIRLWAILFVDLAISSFNETLFPMRVFQCLRIRLTSDWKALPYHSSPQQILLCILQLACRFVKLQTYGLSMCLIISKLSLLTIHLWNVQSVYPLQENYCFECLVDIQNGFPLCYYAENSLA